MYFPRNTFASLFCVASSLSESFLAAAADETRRGIFSTSSTRSVASLKFESSHRKPNANRPAATTRGSIVAMAESIPEPNPPRWPDTVKIITPDMTSEEILEIVTPIQDPPQEWTDFDDPEKPKRWGYNSDRHFVEERYAILFAPGAYSVDVEVGYYVQLAGLGARADDVVFKDCERGPFCEALNKHRKVGGRPGLSLDTFWRSAENFRTEARRGQLWAVSQAAPLRRVHIGGDLILHDKGAYASGGHLANAVVEGRIEFGSQQQWLCRSVDLEKNSDWNEALGGWSMVFVDCKNPPNARDGKTANPSVTVNNPEITVEKPFVALKDDGKYELRVPSPRKRNVGGEALGSDLVGSNDDARDFSRVRVAVATVQDKNGADVPDPNVSEKINAALEEGKDIVFSPGMYYLKESLKVKHSNQVILGLGLATLVAPVDGTPCIQVAGNLEGVRIAGLMLEASVISESSRTAVVASLLEWGEEGTSEDDRGNGDNPGVLTDVFARVGGSNLNRQVSTDVMLRLHSGNVVGDNLWLWRADHVALRPDEEPNFPPLDYHQVVAGECPVRTGIEVNGHNVTIHGLAVEHATEHQTVWNGEGGNVQFYQCEFPYDVTPRFGEEKFLGYKVHESVSRHLVGGIGVYSNFRDHEVPVDTAIYHPQPDQVTNPFTIKLDNRGTIKTVMNNRGGPAEEEGVPVRIQEGGSGGNTCAVL